EQGRVDRLVCRVESAAEMPLSLIGGVVAKLVQSMPDGHHLRGHVALPGSLHVVEDSRMLDVLSGVDDRARRRAHLRSSLVIGERSAVLPQVLPPRYR